MSRLRAIFVLLIPACWLVGSVNGSAFVLSPAGAQSGSVLSPAGPGKHAVPLCDSSATQAVRRSARRPGIQPGSAGTPALALLKQSLFASPDRIADAHLGLPRPALALAQCWQFHWRTALEPRAPSSVSRLCS